MLGHERSEGGLSRKRVKPPTQKLYTDLSTIFLLKYHLNETSPAQELDQGRDTELDQFYLLGHNAHPQQMFFYAVRWYPWLSNSLLPLSCQARQGHARAQRPNLQPPETWEAVLLMAQALVNDTDGKFPESKRLGAAVAILLGFDLYGRATDLPRALASELRSPSNTQIGAAAAWTLTLFPLTSSVESKTPTMDDTLSIGTFHPRRAWLQTICPGILTLTHPNGLLLGVTTADYYILFQRATDLADLFKSSPHRQRHGAASANAL